LLLVLAWPAVAAPAAKPKRGSVPQILVVSRPWPGLVTVRVSIAGGAALDPPGQEGLSLLGWSSTLRGAGSRGHAELSAAFDALGASVGVSVDKTAATLSGDVAIDQLEPMLRLLADVLLRPQLQAKEVEAVRDELLAELSHLRDDDDALAHDALGRYLYRGQAIGRSSMGTEKSLRAIDPASLAAWHRRQVHAGSVRIGFAGAIDRSRAEALVQSVFGELPAAKPLKSVASKLVQSGRRLLLIDKPRRSQAQVMLGLSTVAAAHKDMLPLVVANAVLGGAFTSRLNREIRELRGWSYGTFATLSAGPGVSTWAMGFAPAHRNAVAALELAVRLVEELRQHGVTAAELRFAKDWLIGAHRLSLETADRELAQRMRGLELGLSERDLDTWVERIEAVDLKTLHKVLRERLKPEHLVAVVVGPAKPLRDKLAATTAGFAVEQIAADGAPEATSALGRVETSRPAAEPEPETDAIEGPGEDSEGMEAEPPEDAP
jgi:zinc protease